MNVDDTGRDDDEEDILRNALMMTDDDVDDNHDVEVNQPSWLLQWSDGGACTVGGGTGEDGPFEQDFEQ